MRIEQFLTKYVGGYLFKDLENMAAIILPEGQSDGAAGYPMMMTILAGMELLGGILSDKQFDMERGDAHFKQYWVHFLTRARPSYGSLKDGHIILRKLVRHGLMHRFVTAPGIQITKGDAARHLRFYPSKQILFIDCLQFFDDLKGSYEQLVVPIVEGAPLAMGRITISKDTMQDRLDEVIGASTHETVGLFQRLADRPTSDMSMTAIASASFNFPPRGTVINRREGES